LVQAPANAASQQVVTPSEYCVRVCWKPKDRRFLSL
jgi:hypothetical protein